MNFHALYCELTYEDSRGDLERGPIGARRAYAVGVLERPPGAPARLLRLYEVDRQFLFASLRDYCAESETNMKRNVDIARDSKAPDQVFPVHSLLAGGPTSV